MAYLGNSPQQNIRQRYYYNATAGQTVFSGNDITGISLKYQDGKYLDVYVNGALLQNEEDYTAIDRSSVVLSSGAQANDIIEIIAYGVFSVADTVSSSLGGTFSNNIVVDGTLGVSSNIGIGTITPTSNLHVIGTANITSALTAASIELGHPSDTTLARLSAGNVTIEGNIIYRAGGTDVPIADGGTGASDAANARTNLGLGTNAAPTFTNLNIDGVAGTNRNILYKTSGANRWGLITTNITETGSNAGSNFVINRYDDAGASLGTAITINRSTGITTISQLQLTTDLAIADGGTGASDAATARTNLGVGNTDGPIFAGVILNNRAGTSRYVQYHTNNTIRWGVSASGTAESGSNTGSDYVISRWADDGSFISNPFLITRSTGSVKIGGAGNRSTTEPTNALSLFNGTAPAGTLTNGVTLYASAGELRVMDSAGNATLLSPHDDITNEWIFDSTESTNGRNLRIRVEALLRKINSEFGWDYVLDIAGDGTDQSKTMAERVNEEREKRLATFTFNGKLYDLNRTAKTDIAGAGTLALSAIMLENAQPGNLRWADPTSDFGWIAYDNTITLMDAQTTLAFAKEAAAHYKKIIFAARSIKDMNPIPEDFMNDSYWS